MPQTCCPHTTKEREAFKKEGMVVVAGPAVKARDGKGCANGVVSTAVTKTLPLTEETLEEWLGRINDHCDNTPPAQWTLFDT